MPGGARSFLTPERRERWRRVQESFSRITGLALWTVDDAGKVIGRPSSPPQLCLLLRDNREARALCNDDCIRNCQRALRSNSTVFFRCHADLHCFAAPLRADGQAVGVLLGGQVLTGSPPLEKYRELARRAGLAEDEVVRSVGRLTLGTERSLRQAADLVAEMSETVFSSWDAQSRMSRRLTMLSNLFTLGGEFTPDMNAYEVYALVLNSLAVLLDLQCGALLTDGGRGGMLAVRYAFGPDHEKLMGIRLPPDSSFLEPLIRRREPVVSDEYHLLLQSGFPESVRQVSLFPVHAGGELKGVLAAFNRPLDEDERRMVAYVAGQSALTLQNASLREELRRRIGALASLARFNEKAVGAVGLDELLRVIFDEAATLASAERASLMLLNEKTRELMVKLVRGAREDVLRNFTVPLDEGIAGQVAKGGEPLLVTDLERDERFGRPNRPNYRTPSFVILPLKSGGRTIGVLNIGDRIDGRVYNQDDLAVLRSLATQATVALERSELYALSRELKQISITDPLTGLLNRRYFQERATEELERSKRFGQPLSLIMLDVDDFKYYNDRHGHPAGDDVLKTIGSILKAMVRTIDVVSRYGGEEFAILCPNSEKEGALAIAGRVAQGTREHIFNREVEQPGGDLTISAGVATSPDDAATLEELINNADKALYLSKKAGKNRATPFKLSA